jgi:hypothetical protein
LLFRKQGFDREVEGPSPAIGGERLTDQCGVLGATLFEFQASRSSKRPLDEGFSEARLPLSLSGMR